MTTFLDPEPGLADRLREHTLGLHRQAERSGFVRAVLRGRASRYGYALFLRNLLPAYRQLETALDRHRQTPGVRLIIRPEIDRAPAIEADLAALYGPRWEQSLPLLTASVAYADRIGVVDRGDASRLIGHAYVRYLGDLNGGRIIRRCLMRSPGLSPEALAFYDFPEIGDMERFKIVYRHGFDRTVAEIADSEGVIDEAIRAFGFNIALADAVGVAAGESG